MYGDLRRGNFDGDEGDSFRSADCWWVADRGRARSSFGLGSRVSRDGSSRSRHWRDNASVKADDSRDELTPFPFLPKPGEMGHPSLFMAVTEPVPAGSRAREFA